MSIRYPGKPQDLSNDWYVKIDEKKYQNYGAIEFLGDPFNAKEEIEKIPRKDFEIVYPRVLGKILLDLGNRKIRVFEYLLRHKDGKNCINMSQRKLAEEIQVSLQTVSSTITYLLNAEVLTRSGNGYRISPKLMVKGDKQKEAYIEKKFREECAKGKEISVKKEASDDWYLKIDGDIYQNNGAIVKLGEPFRAEDEIRKIPRGSFEIIYPQKLCQILYDLGNQKIQIFAYLLEHKDSGNCINTSWSKLEKATASCSETVRSTIGYLTDEGFLTRNGSVYRISPKIMIQGNKQKEAYIGMQFWEEYEIQKEIRAARQRGKECSDLEEVCTKEEAHTEKPFDAKGEN